MRPYSDHKKVAKHYCVWNNVGKFLFRVLQNVSVLIITVRDSVQGFVMAR